MFHFKISEDPVDGTYCHCHGCQILHGAPFQWACIFRKEGIQFTKGVDKLLFYNSGTMQPIHELPCKVISTLFSPLLSPLFLLFPLPFPPLLILSFCSSISFWDTFSGLVFLGKSHSVYKGSGQITILQSWYHATYP